MREVWFVSGGLEELVAGRVGGGLDHEGGGLPIVQIAPDQLENLRTTHWPTSSEKQSLSS